MATIVIKELDKTFKNKEELIQYVITQNKALSYATTKIKDLEEQLSDAQNQVKPVETTQVAKSTTRIVKSIPEALCQIEIDRLMDKAVSQPLNFEETKKLDILIRNYYLAKEHEFNTNKDNKPPTDIVLTDEQLIDIAVKS